MLYVSARLYLLSRLSTIASNNFLNIKLYSITSKVYADYHVFCESDPYL